MELAGSLLAQGSTKQLLTNNEMMTVKLHLVADAQRYEIKLGNNFFHKTEQESIMEGHFILHILLLRYYYYIILLLH